MGRNNHGQLGTGSEAHDSAVPRQVEALAGTRVGLLAAGFYHSICLTGSSVAAPPTTSRQNSLAVDLRRMLNSPARSDVTFMVEGRPIYAHRCIIMARCEPLERMLDGPMRESQQHEIVLPGARWEVVLALCEFLYTDCVESLEETAAVELDFALDLLALADQYLVDDLKRLCESAIQKSISVENVALMLATADARQAAALRQRCFDFVLRNFGKVIGTQVLLRPRQFATHALWLTRLPSTPLAPLPAAGLASPSCQRTFCRRFCLRPTSAACFSGRDSGTCGSRVCFCA